MSAGLAPALTDYRPIETSFEGYKREQSSIDAPPVEQQGPVARDHVLSGGRPSWPLVEYLFHRYVPYGRFPPGESLLGGLVHEMLDTLHREQHHEKPFDGRHINAQLKDFLPLFFVAAPFSFLLPVYTLPALLAGVVQSFVGKAWAHYFLHFGQSRNRFFRYLRRCHLYHHGQRGMENGYGIASGILDCVFHTEYRKPVRRSLSKGGGHAIRVKKMTRSEALRLFREGFKQQ